MLANFLCREALASISGMLTTAGRHSIRWLILTDVNYSPWGFAICAWTRCLKCLSSKMMILTVFLVHMLTNHTYLPAKTTSANYYTLFWLNLNKPKLGSSKKVDFPTPHMVSTFGNLDVLLLEYYYLRQPAELVLSRRQRTRIDIIARKINRSTRLLPK